MNSESSRLPVSALAYVVIVINLVRCRVFPSPVRALTSNSIFDRLFSLLFSNIAKGFYFLVTPKAKRLSLI